MVRTLALRCEEDRFKTCSHHLLVVPGSTLAALVNGLPSVSWDLFVVLLISFVDCVSLALKSAQGERSIK